MRIRPFTIEDYDRVWLLWHVCHVPLGSSDTREAIQRKLERDPDLFLVAEENRVIMGVIIGSWDGRQGLIYNHAVDPTMRRRGLGRQLFQEVENRLLEKGCHQISILVPAGSLEGEEFFRSMGFKPEERYLTLVKTIPGK
ncbi:MAG: GNAT family N-acetyltransferase [Chloroflexota bacterium]|nr:GNAT family N-acetyltransferase [Chloroflexota bacterium]